MHFFSVPSTIQRLFPSCTWRREVSEKVVFLTFDDGPHPRITPWVLDTLRQYDARATFFCVGDNIQKFPEVARLALEDGHTLANHTMHHVKGWRFAADAYLEEVMACEEVLAAVGAETGRLFRPPYGKITLRQTRALKARGYEVVQWSNLSCDYDRNLIVDRSLQALLNHSKPGSIVVFHDSEKAENQLKYLLPKYLEGMKSIGYTFRAL
ncbi:MAG: polysaccharide deacetylase family protein [Bacteroidota bacterium]